MASVEPPPWGPPFTDENLEAQRRSRDCVDCRARKGQSRTQHVSPGHRDQGLVTIRALQVIGWLRGGGTPVASVRFLPAALLPTRPLWCVSSIAHPPTSLPLTKMTKSSLKGAGAGTHQQEMPNPALPRACLLRETCLASGCMGGGCGRSPTQCPKSLDAGCTLSPARGL